MTAKKNTLSIATATIAIKVIQVDGHKMTKATFRQIKAIKLEQWPKNSSILGWVNDNGANLIWEDNGKLYRSNIDSWGVTHLDGSRTPIIDRLEQLFIAT